MKTRFLYNNDGTFLLGNALHGHRPLTPTDVEDYVDIVADSQVTTFLMCTNASMPYYPSRVERHLGDPGNRPLPADAGGSRFATMAANIRGLADQGTDIVTLTLDRAHRRGLEAFATVRMNDLHFHDPDTYDPLTQGDFWLDHPECRVGEHPGWHANGALDYAQPLVREHWLAFLAEVAERFPVDGIELDFLRMPVYFRRGEGPANLATMTDFVRAARDIVGHLAVRVPADPGCWPMIGLAPDAWAREKLVDFVTVGAFYIDDPVIDIGAARTVLPDVPLYATIERRLARSGGNELRAHDLYRSAAARLFDQDADGIYLFNFFFAPVGQSRFARVADPDGIWHFPAGMGPAQALLHELGRPETLRGRPKRYALAASRHDFDRPCPRTLPHSLAAGGEVTFNLTVAHDPPCRRATLLVRGRGVGTPRVAVNEGIPDDLPVATTIPDFPSDWPLDADQHLHAWAIPPGLLRVGANALRLVADAPFEVLQADLAVFPE